MYREFSMYTLVLLNGISACTFVLVVTCNTPEINYADTPVRINSAACKLL